MKKKTLVIIMCVLTLFALCVAFASCGDSKGKSCLEGGDVHDWGRWETKNATCGAPSSRFRECYDCGEIQENENYTPQPATGAHIYNDNYICTVCGQISPNRPDCDQGGQIHDVRNAVTSTATCAAPGTKRGTCNLCGQYITEEIEPALGHIWGTNQLGFLQVERACERPGCDVKQVRAMKNIASQAKVEVQKNGGWGESNGSIVVDGNWDDPAYGTGIAFAPDGAIILTFTNAVRIDQLAIAGGGVSFDIEILREDGTDYEILTSGSSAKNSKETAFVVNMSDFIDDSVLVKSIRVTQTNTTNGTQVWGEIAVGQIDERTAWTTQQ